MKHILLLASLITLPPLVFAQAPKEAKTDDSPEKVVRQLERQRVDAVVRADIKTLDRILSDEMIYTHSTGLVDTKRSFIDNLKSGATKYEGMDHDEVTVRMFPGMAVITGRSAVKVRSGGAAEVRSFKIRFTSVYVSHGGRWQMVAWQSTRLP